MTAISNFTGTSAQSLTMSSREIAELTGKNHADVLRDIRNMLDVLKKDASSFAGIYKDAYGRDKPCFNLDRELTMTLVSGYDIPLRHRVVTRLAELEAQASAPAFHIPQTYAEAMRVAANLAEKNDELRGENTQLKMQLANRPADPTIGMKALNMLGPAAKALRDSGIPKQQALAQALEEVHRQTGVRMLPGYTPEKAKAQTDTARLLKYIQTAKRYAKDARFGTLCAQGVMPHSKLLKLVAVSAQEFADMVSQAVRSGLIEEAHQPGYNGTAYALARQ